MKRIILSVLCIVLLMTSAIGLVACNKEQHTHDFTEQVAEEKYLASEATCTESAKYYYSCSCGAIGEATFEHGNALGHSFTNYISDGNATCTNDGTKTAKCDRCEASDTITDEGSKIDHTFNQQVAEDKYLATKATCMEPAKYYYSCSCGAIGEATFEHGNALDHSFINYISDGNATCTNDGTKTAKCDRCEVFDTITDEGSKIAHTFNQQVVEGKYLATKATCTESAKYYYSCSCGAIGEATFEHGNALGHSYSTKWSSNETYHWHAATCEHNDEVSDKAEHEFEGDVCKTCGCPKPILASEGLEFIINDDGAYSVSGIGTCKDTDIVIPSKYNDLPVKRIGEAAFRDCTNLTSVVIPDSVVSIGNKTFWGATD